VMTTANVFVKPAKTTARTAGLPEQMAKLKRFPRSRSKRRPRVLTHSEIGDDWALPSLLGISPRPQKSIFGHTFPREPRGRSPSSRIRNRHPLANRPLEIRVKASGLKLHGRERESLIICSLHPGNPRKPVRVLLSKWSPTHASHRP
jgi:hypothetical protein